jgi:hypothetical protein
VHVHKFVAFLIWGWAAFEPGIHVRHRDGNTENNTKANLLLGTPSQNERDKPVHVRAASARAARAAQGRVPRNARLTIEEAEHIRGELRLALGSSGRVRRGVVKEFATRYGVTPSTISLVGKGKTWIASNS